MYWDENKGWTVISPESVTGDFTNYNQDIVLKPSNTSWSNASATTYCESPNLFSRNSIDFRNLENTSIANVFVCHKTFDTIDYFNFQKRMVFSVEYQPGYPLNESSVTDNPQITLTTNAIKVFNDSNSTEIIPTSGWYLIPAGTNVRIEKSVLMPALIHYDDIDVADLATFSSYSERRLDKSTTWNIDTGITITRVVDPGDPTQIDNQTPTVQSIGDGIKTYTIGR